MPAFERHLARFEVDGQAASSHYLDTERPVTPIDAEAHAQRRHSSKSRALNRGVRPVLMPISEQTSSQTVHGSAPSKPSMVIDSTVRLPAHGTSLHRSPSFGSSPTKKEAVQRERMSSSSMASTTCDSIGSSSLVSSSSSCWTPQSVLSASDSSCSPNSRFSAVDTPPRKPMTVSLPAAPPSPPMKASASRGALAAAGAWQGDVRLLLIRHAQSANKGRKSLGKKACPDPELTDLGYDQADLLAKRMAREFRQKKPNLLIVSSPMRRCLLTILPSVKSLPIDQENCLCHGSCYEYGAVGRHFNGTHCDDIASEFPDFRLLGFSADGHWHMNIRGDKEEETDCRERGEKMKTWLLSEAVPQLRMLSQDMPAASPVRNRELPTLAFVTHQTIADLLCHLLVASTGDDWHYGDIRYRLSNASMTEIIIHPDGTADFGEFNDGSHLMGGNAMGQTFSAARGSWSSSPTWGAQHFASTWA